MEEYTLLHTYDDTCKEKYIYGCHLVGKYGFPQLERSLVDVQGLSPIDFSHAKSVVKTKQSVCHFFTEDKAFERVWNNAELYVEMLKNFKAVCSPDFSAWGSMPLALQIYQVYRNRAIAYYLWQRGVEIIPTVSWCGEDSYDWIFDGLPQNSVLAVSTNGCHRRESREAYRKGFHEMVKRLHPVKVVSVGIPIEVNDDVEVINFEGCGEQMKRRIANGR